MGDDFTELYDTYRDQIYYYFYRTLHNPHIAEELTHDTFLKAFRSLDSFRGEASLKNWLYVIAVNTYRNHLARQDTVPLPETEDLMNPTDSYRQVNEKVVIELVFSRLCKEERELIALRDISGFAYAEIAVFTSLTVGQVRVKLHRARKKFRTIYSQENREG